LRVVLPINLKGIGVVGAAVVSGLDERGDMKSSRAMRKCWAKGWITWCCRSSESAFILSYPVLTVAREGGGACPNKTISSSLSSRKKHWFSPRSTRPFAFQHRHRDPGAALKAGLGIVADVRTWTGRYFTWRCWHHRRQPQLGAAQGQYGAAADEKLVSCRAGKELGHDFFRAAGARQYGVRPRRRQFPGAVEGRRHDRRVTVSGLHERDDHRLVVEAIARIWGSTSGRWPCRHCRTDRRLTVTGNCRNAIARSVR